MSEQNMATKEKIAVWKLILGCLAGFILIAGFTMILRSRTTAPDEASAKVVQERLDRLEKLRAEDHDVLTTYAWVDKDAGVVRVPVDVAMKMAVKKLSTKPVGKSAVAVPAPVVAPAPVAPAPEAEKKAEDPKEG